MTDNELWKLISTLQEQNKEAVARAVELAAILTEILQDRTNYTWFDGEWEATHCNVCGNVLAKRDWKAKGTPWVELEDAHEPDCPVGRGLKLLGIK